MCLWRAKEGFQGWSYNNVFASNKSMVPENRFAAFYMKSPCGKYVSTCARNKACLVSDMAYADLWTLVPTGDENYPDRYYLRLWSNAYYLNTKDDRLSASGKEPLAGLHQQPEAFNILLDKDPGKFYISNAKGKYLEKDYSGYLRFTSKEPVGYNAIYVNDHTSS